MHRIRGILAAVAASLLTACFLAAEQGPPPNFGVVVEGAIYRGGQPEDEQFDHLKSIGVRTIVKLNSQELGAEETAAARLGIELVSIPFDASTIGNPETCPDVSRALALITDKANWPVYVHCAVGRDRTGYIVGLYRERVEKWDWPRVSEELTRYGHDASMREAFPQISRELARGARCGGE